MIEIKFDLIYKGETRFHHKKYHLCELMRGVDKICDIHHMMDLVATRQFTGLLDKNSVEIYEGDILKRFHFQCVDGFNHYIYHAIKWSEKYNGWIALNLNSMSESDGSPHLFVYAKGEHEVIGNIYENPGLLEQEK